MVLQTIYTNPDGTFRTRTYRGVKPWQKSEFMKTFYDMRTVYPAGQLVQLNGRVRTVVAKFGKEM